MGFRLAAVPIRGEMGRNFFLLLPDAIPRSNRLSRKLSSFAAAALNCGI